MKEDGDNIIKSLTARTGRKSFVVGPRLTACKRANLRAPNLNLKAGRPGRTVMTHTVVRGAQFRRRKAQLR